MSNRNVSQVTPAAAGPDSESSAGFPAEPGFRSNHGEPDYLDTARLRDRFLAHCRYNMVIADGAIIWHGKKPLPLLAEATQCLTVEDTVDIRDALEQRLSDTIAPDCNLLTFYWQSPGPCTWTAGIRERHLAGRCFYTVRTDDREYVIAALEKEIEPGDGARLFVTDFFRTNGCYYGLPLFGSLPTDTFNHVPDILSIHRVANCYLDFMNWKVAEGDTGAWVALEESLISELAMPDTQTRVVDMLKQRTSDGYLEAIEKYEEERAGEIDNRAKGYLLGRYFRQSYQEARR